jgi:GTP-binding protein SAR1
MGLLDWLFGVLERLGLFTKHGRVLFLGLDNAGKTTLLHLIATGKRQAHTPTVHPTSEELHVGGMNFNVFDLGGHEQARRTWRDYYASVDGVVFMVDVADRERVPEVRTELNALLAAEELAEVPFLVLGNKCDIRGSMTEAELRASLMLAGAEGADGAGAARAAAADGREPRRVGLFMCSLVDDYGYEEGFRWLASLL